MTQKVFPNKNIDYEILKEKIIKTIGSIIRPGFVNTIFQKKESYAVFFKAAYF